MSSISELKARAKESLKGKYGDAIVVILLSGLISGAFGVIQTVGNNMNNYGLTMVGSLISFIVTGLISFGSVSFFLKLSRNEEVDYKELFTKTNMLVPYLLISLLTGIFVFLWSLLFIIPGIIAAIAYSQVMLIALDNPEMDPMDVLKKSKEMMQGHKLDFVILNLSFLGWMILGAFTAGILYLWLIPYMTVTQYNFYNELKEQKNLD